METSQTCSQDPMQLAKLECYISEQQRPQSRLVGEIESNWNFCTGQWQIL